MSLNFKLDKIKDYKTVCWDGDVMADGKMKLVTESLIWTTMQVGLGSITEENIPEWLVRLDLVDRLFGTMMVRYDGDKRVNVPFTKEDLVAHIGLTTNVSKETRTKFLKRTMDHFVRESEHRAEVA